MIALDTLTTTILCPLPSLAISSQSARVPTESTASAAAMHSLGAMAVTFAIDAGFAAPGAIDPNMTIDKCPQSAKSKGI
jgi:hypothetical protein